ncbi:glutamate--tRNA ligase [Candidatus Vidania fulgoroideorum]
MIEKRKVKTRFAPSPTGELHIGNLRTAIFAWAFSKKEKGKFLVRIDNTDIERSKKKYEVNILKTLNAFNINYCKLIFQKKRLRIYKKYGFLIYKSGRGYFRNGALFLKVSKIGSIKFYDEIRGNIKTKKRLIKDFVLIRKNGISTYNFSCVVDDYLEKVTHIFRGEEHISNTFKQKLIIKYLNFRVPKYIHLPLIFNKDGKKVSKKEGILSILDLIKKGFLRKSIFNYIINLGWRLKNKEFFSLKEFVSKFEINHLNKSSPKHDIRKLYWYNKHYIRIINNRKILKVLNNKYSSNFRNKEIVNFLKRGCLRINDLFRNYELNFLKKETIEEKTNVQNLILIRNIICLDKNKKQILKEVVKTSKKYKISYKSVYEKLNLSFFKKKKDVPDILDLLCNSKKSEIVKVYNVLLI